MCFSLTTQLVYYETILPNTLKSEIFPTDLLTAVCDKIPHYITLFRDDIALVSTLPIVVKQDRKLHNEYVVGLCDAEATFTISVTKDNRVRRILSSFISFNR